MSHLMSGSISSVASIIRTLMCPGENISVGLCQLVCCLFVIFCIQIVYYMYVCHILTGIMIESVGNNLTTQMSEMQCSNCAHLHKIFHASTIIVILSIIIIPTHEGMIIAYVVTGRVFAILHKLLLTSPLYNLHISGVIHNHDTSSPV